MLYKNQVCNPAFLKLLGLILYNLHSAQKGFQLVWLGHVNEIVQDSSKTLCVLVIVPDLPLCL